MRETHRRHALVNLRVMANNRRISQLFAPAVAPITKRLQNGPHQTVISVLITQNSFGGSGAMVGFAVVMNVYYIFDHVMSCASRRRQMFVNFHRHANQLGL